MTLTVHIGYLNDGQYANLYYYSPETKALEFKGSSKINGAGNAKFDFDLASDYVILVSDVAISYLNTANKTTAKETNTSNPITGGSNPIRFISIIAILSVVALTVVSKNRKLKVVK